MNKAMLFKIVEEVVARGLEAIKRNTKGYEFVLDYVAVFTKDQAEFDEMVACVEPLGSEVDKETAKTGRTFKLTKSAEVEGGIVDFLKIRRPDPTRSQRGGPDFVVNTYQKFKEEYLSSSGNFTLMVRKDYEMIELKGIDVLVYVKAEPFSKHVKI